MRVFSKYLADESGATAAEYGLIIALVAAAIITAFGLLGTHISGVVTNVANSVTGG